MSICPTCNKEYKRLGSHWRYNPKHRPLLTNKQKDIIKGLLMGDGSLDIENLSVKVECISKNYLKYLKNIFHSLSCDVSLKRTAEESAKRVRDNGFRPKANKENYSDMYLWYTRKIPELEQFVSWYTDVGKVWPEDIELTPTVLKHWYCGDGHKDGRGRISIYTSNEYDNGEKLKKYFKDVDLPTPRVYESDRGDMSLNFNRNQSKILLEYMGNPLPDFEYKW